MLYDSIHRLSTSSLEVELLGGFADYCARQRISDRSVVNRTN